MFKCDFDLCDECQLYSVKCKERPECELLNNCSTCRFKMRSWNDEPCARCDAINERLKGKSDAK